MEHRPSHFPAAAPAGDAGSFHSRPAWLAIWLPNFGFLAAGAALTLRLE